MRYAYIHVHGDVSMIQLPRSSYNYHIHENIHLLMTWLSSLQVATKYSVITGIHLLHGRRYRCNNRRRCPLARMSGLQCFNMGHNGHGINLYGVSMNLMGN